jgi:putative membrane protein
MLEHGVPAAALVVALVVYGRGVGTLWRRAGPGRGIGVGRVVAFLAGWTVALVAVAPPIGDLTHELLWIHMIQHVLLVLVAAPLIALGSPAFAAAWTLPARWRRHGIRWGRRLVGAAFLAWAVHAVTLWAWHVPALYEAALASDAVHLLEHATLTATAVLFWAAQVDATRRSRLGVAASYVFATALSSTALGMLLTVAPRPWYAHYAATAEAFGLTALEDQQVAGLVMWIPGGAILALAALALVRAWIGEAGRRVVHTRVERVRHERAAAVALVTAFGLAAALAGCDDVRGVAIRMTGGDPAHGRQALRAYGCWTCHTIPGVPGANGVTGPSLDGLAGRAFVAGQPNSPEHLMRWIRNAPAVRPATPMPNMDVTERDGRDIAAYLYTLR